MKCFALALITLTAFGQSIKVNPVTGLLDLVGSASGVTSVGAGASGALSCTGTTNVLCDIVTAYVPGKTTSNTWTGVNDFSGATSTKPMKVATSDPATCGVGEFLYRSDTDALKKCSAVNTWTAVSGGTTISGPYWLSGSTYYLSNLITAYRPSLLTLSWVNQGSSTVGGTGYESLVVVQGGSTGGAHARAATLTTTTVEGWFAYTPAFDASGNNEPCGLYLRESSTAKIFIAGPKTTGGVPKVFGGYYTSDGTVFGGTSFQPNSPPISYIFGLRMVLSGGTWTTYFSSGALATSGSAAWGFVGTVAATTAFTTAANQFGYAAFDPTPGGQTSTCTALSLREL